MTCIGNASLDDETAAKEAYDWLLVYHQPESRLMEYWNKTARLRLNFIRSVHNDSNEKPTLHDVLNKWPRYKDKNGDVLVRNCFL